MMVQNKSAGFKVAGMGALLAVITAMMVFPQNSPVARAATVPYTWRNVEIVAGGFVTGIVFSPKQPGLMYARTDIGGVYRWDMGAKRWMPLTDWAGRNNANLNGGESVAPDPVDANRVYIAGGMYSRNGPVAIMSSTDQGRTLLPNYVPFEMGGNEDGRSVGERLAIDPNKNSILYFGSRNDGLWRSEDYAKTWTKVNAFPVTGRTNGIGIACVIFDKRGGTTGNVTPTIYVGMAVGPVGLYRSTDGGATWAAVAGQPTGLVVHHAVLDADGALYLTYGNNAGPNGMTDGAVWKYDTKGGAWMDISPLKPRVGGNGNFGYAGLALDAQHPGTLMVTTMDRWWPTDEIFRTTDGGKTWKGLSAQAQRDSTLSPYLKWGGDTPRFGWWIGTLAIDPFHSGHALYGTGATIWETEDATASDAGGATHWAVGAKGLEETAVLDLFSPTTGPHLISALGDIGGFAHNDLNVSPPQGFFSNPTFSNTDSLDGAGLVVARVGRADNKSRRGAYSLDGGAIWKPFATEPPGSQGSGTVAVATGGKTIIWTPRGSAPYFTRDYGATWAASADLPRNARPVADRVNASKFYATANGRLYLSADGGATFTAGAQNLPGNGALHATPGREGDVWLAGDNGLFHSTDSGANFVRVDSAQEVYAFGFGHAAPGQDYPALFMAGKTGDVQGLFRSDDAGITWVRINDDQHQYGWINPITGDPRIFGRVYIGTNGRGVLYGDPQ